MSEEKIKSLRAFGAKVVVTPTAVEPDDPKRAENEDQRSFEKNLLPGGECLVCGGVDSYAGFHHFFSAEGRAPNEKNSGELGTEPLL